MRRLTGWAKGRAAEAGRVCKPRVCRACGAVVLRGPDGDTAAMIVEVDVLPVGIVGEALALVTNRATFTRWRVREGFELDVRDLWGIAAKPAGSDLCRFDVHARHVCGQPLPSISSRFEQPARPDTDEPGF